MHPVVKVAERRRWLRARRNVNAADVDCAGMERGIYYVGHLLRWSKVYLGLK